MFVNVLPTIREIPVEVDPRTRQHMPDSDEYATDRKGEDVSEIYAIREYRPGDSMKAIHWKLSARTKHWMVKEFSFPRACRCFCCWIFTRPARKTSGRRRWMPFWEIFPPFLTVWREKA
ncbi:MAG: DUF58 domain-containing protein [Lachnospiraceae bacterium]